MKSATYLQSLLLGITLLSLCSCASTGNPQVAQARQKFQTRKVYAQGIGLGALLGAGAGALNGLQVNQNGIRFDKNRAAQGAMVGGGLGAIGGWAHVNQLERNRRNYAAQAQSLENAIAQTRSTKSAAASFNRTLAAEVNSMKKGDAALAGTVNDAKSVLAQVNSELTLQRRQLQALASSISRRERNELQEQIYELEGEKTELIGLINKANAKRSGPPLASQ